MVHFSISVSKYSNNCLRIFFLFIFFIIVYKLLPKKSIQRAITLVSGRHPINKCNPIIKTIVIKHPVIALVGPDGSGVEVLRFLIEQLSGFFTGSVHEKNKDIFEFDGHTGSEVIIIQANDLSDLRNIDGVIVVYRDLKHVVRSEFSKKYGQGAFAEAPLRAYYGPNWKSFAISRSEQWLNQYSSYLLENKLLTLIINYDDLYDKKSLETALMRVANFVHFPVDTNIEHCVINGFLDNTLQKLKPKQLKHGFEPFNLLPIYYNERYRAEQKRFNEIVKEKQAKYFPMAIKATRQRPN